MKQPQIAIEHATIPNGLKVVIAPDSTAPVVTVGVYYKIGFRLEPQGRSGFAHLFEHMMFQGSANAPKMQHIKLINSSGGVLNGSTHYDVTNYYEAVPSNALERVLWLEADRMRALKVDDENLRNQRDVVKEEVRVNVMNQPYGGFPWLDLPPVAFRNWANSHNFYGDFADLDAASLADVQSFFKTYYVPNNAVLLILGDVQPGEGIALAKKYFSDIPAGPPPAMQQRVAIFVGSFMAKKFKTVASLRCHRQEFRQTASLEKVIGRSGAKVIGRSGAKVIGRSGAKKANKSKVGTPL